MSDEPWPSDDHSSPGPQESLSVMTAGRSSGRLESELENVVRELSLVDGKLAELLDQQSSLCSRRDQLSSEIQARKKRRVLPQRDWAGDDFEWSVPMADLLRSAFGIDTWRTNQKEIINATVSGRDVFVVMRTGGGKSLCYQLPALLKGGITVVVSPLISLIEDQMRYLNDLVPGSAAMLSAGMDKREATNVYRRMRGEPVEGDAEGAQLVMVLVTPEKVVKSKMFMAALDKTAKNGRLARVVIDEAHCCSQWGHDFRPDYCKLGILKRQFAHVPILAVTATCTDFIRDDVMKILNLTPGDVVCFKSSFNRKNLSYEVVEKPEAAKDSLEQLASFIKENYRGQAGIVYTFSRKEASDVAAGLRSRGVSAAFYHAGQEERERSRVQQTWMSGRVPVIVATIAFGMGINHLEVRFVVHFSLSKSLENYYQESGRAGRDGRPSRCLVFYRPSDVSRQATLSCQDQGSQPLATLHKMVAYCQAMATCRRKMIAEALGEQGGNGLCGGGCDVCSATSESVATVDATRHAVTLVRILRHLASREQRVTPRQLVEAWRAKKGAKAMPDDVAGEDRRPGGLSRSTCERLVLQLLGMGILSDDFHFTGFSVVHYVVTGARAHALESGRLPRVTLQVPDAESEPDGGSGSRTGSKGKRKAKDKAGGKDVATGHRKSKPRKIGGNVEPVDAGGGSDHGRKRKRVVGRGGDTGGAVGYDDDANVVDLCATEDEETDSNKDAAEAEREMPGGDGGKYEGGDFSSEGHEGSGDDARERGGGASSGRCVSAKRRSSCASIVDVGEDSDDFEPTKRRTVKRKGKSRVIKEEKE